MEGLRRDPSAAAGAEYDLIVVGGGIYGAMTALEAARRGLRPLLLERDDFGGATSWNSHRIVHGGLRYLQKLDFGRFRVSVRERSWFLRHFPDFVAPLACLMPLYGNGARRPLVLRAALLANHLLSSRRNQGLQHDRRIRSGGVMTAAETLSLFPAARREGLRGGALWYDAVMKNSQRVLIETLRWACASGAVCVNYIEATGLLSDADQVRGVQAIDRTTDEPTGFAAPLVINCAGPWCTEVAQSMASPADTLFRPSLAFNVLFDREPLSDAAVAVSAPRPGAHTWFLYPREGCIYAGTAHAPWDGDKERPLPTREQLDAMVDDINEAVPGIDLRRHQALRVHAGLLPTTTEGGVRLTVRPRIHVHRRAGGPAGLISVSGVKYTTARHVAESTLRRAYGRRLPAVETGAVRPAATDLPDMNRLVEVAESGDDASAIELAEAITRLIRDEAAVYLDDLLLRRTGWGDHPRNGRRVGDAVCSLLGWDEKRTRTELDRLDEQAWDYSAPSPGF